MAFPDTPILDDFNRANESPLGRYWSASPLYSAGALARIVSNQCAIISGTDAYPMWSQNFGARQQAYSTLAGWASGDALYVCCRGTNWNTPGFTNNFYHVLAVHAGNVFKIEKTVLDSTTTLASTTQALSAGDAIGISAIGQTIQGWYKPSAGGWTKLLEQTDSAITGGGQIGMIMVGAVIIDNFGGGSVPESPGSPTDITGKGSAPFRSGWNYLQDGGGYKPGTAFLSKYVYYGNPGEAGAAAITDFFFPAPPAPPARRIFHIS